MWWECRKIKNNSVARLLTKLGYALEIVKTRCLSNLRTGRVKYALFGRRIS